MERNFESFKHKNTSSTLRHFNRINERLDRCNVSRELVNNAAMFNKHSLDKTATRSVKISARMRVGRNTN